MSLHRWSLRRLLLIWIGGLALQAAILLAPALLVRRAVPDIARFRREREMRHERSRLAERADSISRAAQIAEARASGKVAVTAAGDTQYAIVSMPSGRPVGAARRVVDPIRFIRRTVMPVAWVVTVPLLLFLVTVVWADARAPRQRATAT